MRPEPSSFLTREARRDRQPDPPRPQDPGACSSITAGRKSSGPGTLRVPMQPAIHSDVTFAKEADALRKLAAKWNGVTARERSNYQIYLGDLVRGAQRRKAAPRR